MRNLKDKRVLITGSAQGIGYKMAEHFAKEGAELILTDVNLPLLEKAAATLATASGAKVTYYKMDVTKPDDIAAARLQINQQGGYIHVLVNNAGVVFGGPFLEVSRAKHELTYQINTIGVMSVTHAFMGDMLQQRESHLVNIASASGMVGLPYGSTYAASKWAVIGFTESIRLELELQKNKQMSVSCICPSYINTGMFEGVDAPKLVPWLSPDELAAEVLGAVKSKKHFVMTPFMVKTIPILKGLLPTPMVDMVAEFLGVNTSMRNWKGHGK